MENTEKQGLLTREVANFFDKLEKGESWLQQPSKEPTYVKNAITGKPITGLNAIILQQAMKDQGIENRTVITNEQAKGNNPSGNAYWNPKGQNGYIATLTYNNAKAFYGKNSPEVLSGEKQAGEKRTYPDGKEMRGINFSFVYDASKMTEMKRQPKMNADGSVVRYKYDEVATDERGKAKKYDHDGSYVTKSGKVIEYKKGDYVKVHSAGSTVYETVPTGKKLETTKANAPIINADAADLYKAKDNSPKEVLMEGLTMALRGAMTGDFEGWKPTKEQVSSMKEYYTNHPGEFRGVANTAEARAKGDKETVTRIDAAVEAKAQKKVAENTNTKSKGRSN